MLNFMTSTTGHIAGIAGVRTFGLRHLARKALRSTTNGGSGAFSWVIMLAVLFMLWYMIMPRLRARRRAQAQQHRVEDITDQVPATKPKAAETLPLGITNRDEFKRLFTNIQNAWNADDRELLTKYVTEDAWNHLTTELQQHERDHERSQHTDVQFDDLQRLPTKKDELHVRATISMRDYVVETGMDAQQAHDAAPVQQTTTTWELQRSEQGWVLNRIRS